MVYLNRSIDSQSSQLLRYLQSQSMKSALSDGNYAVIQKILISNGFASED